jgi:hypothetical protein
MPGPVFLKVIDGSLRSRAGRKKSRLTLAGRQIFVPENLLMGVIGCIVYA